jgi:hypothetical protein
MADPLTTAPPAARSGIPAVERLIARFIIRRYVRANPLELAPSLLRAQQRELLTMISAAGPSATRRVQIKRLRGLEASSTNYSLVMVAEHLAKVNHDLAAALESLKAGRSFLLVVQTANYKPSPNVTLNSAVENLNAANARLTAELADTASIRASRVTHPHPWFGELSAETWACFGPFHQALHLKQAHAIVAGLK